MQTGLLGELPKPVNYWRKVLGERQWNFPKDHVFHPEYWVEWHYLSGRFIGDDGVKYGYHLCLFRLGHELHSHFSLSSDGRQVFVESRNQIFIVFEDDQILVNAPLRDDLNICLIMKADELPIIHGISRKSDRPNHASHYYSIPSLKTRGMITWNGKNLRIKEGLSWFDHEFADSIKQKGFSWCFVQAQWGQDGYFMCYLMFDQGEWLKEHSRAILCGEDISENMELSRIPTIKNPVFSMSAGDHQISICGVTKNFPLIQSQIGTYLELPCIVLIDGETEAEGMIEIPKP